MLIRTDIVLNVFESVDVIALIKGGSYDDLNLTVGDALLKRSPVRSLLAMLRMSLLTPRRTSLASSHVRCRTACRQSTTQYANHECIVSSSSTKTPSSEAY